MILPPFCSSRPASGRFFPPARILATSLLPALFLAALEGMGGGRCLGQTPPVGPLVWSALNLDYTTRKPGERFAQFTFWFTNVSSGEVLIRSARSSCFCTVATLPAQPWRIPPGSNGPIEVSMDLAGKSGTVMKSVLVDTTAGMFNLGVKTTIVPPGEGPGAPGGVSEAERLRNMQSALSDRQAVFKRSECAACHADPARGKTDGAQLYAAVCASCHDSPNRASVVPDLQALKHPTDFEHWRKWIRLGRAGSMMPAFAREEGGPLSDQQIDAIASHLARR